MSKYHRNAEFWGAAIAGGVLVAMPAAAGLFRGALGWMDVLVGLMGLGALAVAVAARHGKQRHRAGSE
jgi:hypothetical protein